VSKILESRFLSETKTRYRDFAAYWLEKDCTAVRERKRKRKKRGRREEE
jgi:hypothetical protein